MLKKLIYAAAILVAVSLVTIHISSEEKESVTLSVWFFTDQINKPIEYFMEHYPHINVKTTIMSWEEYPLRFRALQEEAEEKPDLIFLESYYIKEFIESGFFEDLSQAPYNAKSSEFYPYLVQMASDSSGTLRALGWQAMPGGFYFRRSLATKYLGTDDPKKIGKMLSSLEDFLYTASLLDQKSGGKVKILTGYADFMYYALAFKKEPLVNKNKEFVIGSAIHNYFQIAKTLHEKKLTAGFPMWSPEWLERMKDTEATVFGYSFPLWGLQYLLEYQAPNTSGDWGLTSGPSSYFLGGTWIGMAKESKHKKEAWEFLKFLTLNHETLAWYAKETGEFIGNRAVVDKIKQNEIFKDAYLNGQNYYEFFAAEALKVNASLETKYDGKIIDIMQGVLAEYIEGKLAEEEAFKKIKENVKQAFPELTAE
jgi:multiple sugar transport system substrate-binding protein